MNFFATSNITALALCAGAFLLCTEIQAQQSKKRVKLIHTDNLLYDKALVDAQRLIGSVQLEYEGTMFYSDSAYLYANDDFDAFSNIRIVKPGTYNVTGDLGHFNKQQNTATLTNNVTLRDSDMTLTTNYLTFNTNTEIATYAGGGKIVSNANHNTLTSDRGIYHSKTDVFFFRKNVVLKNPDYTVNCDTMQYNNLSEITYFFGPTTIAGDDSEIYCENGYYNTKKDQSRFGKNARVRSEKTLLTGDSIYYDGEAGFGEVFRNVTIRDTTENFLISGQYGKHIEGTKLSFVTQRALLSQFFEADTLFLHADTLKAVPDSMGRKIVYAYHRVKFFKHDIQGKCDSLVYSQADSTMQMFVQPVMWSMQTQITGDSISLQTANGEMQSMLVKGNAFIISDAEAKGDSIKTTNDRYNQIKGRKLTGTFTENELRNVYVEGNGQLIYFPTNDEQAKPLAMGHNKGECSNINITIDDRKFSRIRMETETNSKFSPMNLSDETHFKLDGFNWREGERPKLMMDIFE
ncbi:MAG: OstA-like protein [Flavobacteriales bacterium]